MTRFRFPPARKLSYTLLAFAMLLAGTFLIASPDSAESASPSLIAVNSARLLETRSGRPTVDGQHQGIGRVRAGSTVTVGVAGRGGVPLDAVSVLVNVTAINPSADGHVTVFQCGTPRPNTSSLNYAGGDIIANSVFVRLNRGQMCLFAQTDIDLAIDVQGFATDGTTLMSTTSARLIDTRVDGVTVDGSSQAGGTVEAGSITRFGVARRAGVPRDATAAMLVLTVTEPRAAGLLTAYACGDNPPDAASLNFSAGRSTAGSVLVDLDKRGDVCVYSSTSTHIVADLQGYLPSGSPLTTTPPQRLLDSRWFGESVDGTATAIGALEAGSTTTLQVAGRGDVPSDAVGAVLKVAAVTARSDGYLTVFACDAPRPATSNLNYVTFATRSNLVFTALSGQGTVCIYSFGTTDVVVDVEGAIRQSTATTTKKASNGRTRNGVGVAPAPVESTTTTPVASTLPPAPTTTAVVTLPATSTTAPTTVATTVPSATTTIPVITLPPTTTTPTTTIPVVTLPPTTTTPTTTAPPNPGSGFVHPGVFVDGAQLDEVRAHVAAGREPWASAIDKVYNSGSSEKTLARATGYRFSSLSYQPAPFRVIQASSSGTQSYLDAHGLTEIGDVEHLDDARAAYTHALLWYATGNKAHADKAIQIMNAWSATLDEIKFDQPRRTDNGNLIWVNGKLQAGWGGTLFARAGEIIRHSGAGWSNNDIARFETMLRDVYLPLTIDGWSNGANWLMTLSEATISIGVFLDDRAAFNAGIDMWRKMTPTTIYHSNDGPRPLSPASWMDTPSEIDDYWRNPNRYITGLQGETLRDLAHMTMGIGAMANAAETAYIQGVNLYGEQANRIVAGFELNAGYLNDYLDETARLGRAPSSTWTPTNWPGDPGSFSIINRYHEAGWLVAHHHYTTRTNTPMPETSRLVKRLGTNAAQPALHLSWEPLTHS